MANLKERMKSIADADIEIVMVKNAEYGESWKKRGGTGCFHQALSRKWDRIEEMVRRHGYDLFAAIREDEGKGEPLMETLRDLRRYLLLIEAEVMSWTDKPISSRSDANIALTEFEQRAKIIARVRPDGQEHPFGWEPDEE